MPPFVTEGVILRSVDFQERDRLITFYGDQRGKLRGVAKGAKASRKRFGANLDLLAHVRIRGFEKSSQSLVRIEGADLIDYFQGCRKDLQAFARACYLAEWMDGCTAERQPVAGLLPLLLRILALLGEERGAGESYLRIFEVKALGLAGYGARFDRCAACDKALEEGSHLVVQVERGGPLCRRCGREGRGIRVSRGTLRLLDDAWKSPLDRIHRIGFSTLAVEEGRTLLRALYEYHVGQPLRSGRFLEDMGRTEPR
jgi:DNA repair protein RecO (recombination protein O)